MKSSVLCILCFASFVEPPGPISFSHKGFLTKRNLIRQTAREDAEVKTESQALRLSLAITEGMLVCKKTPSKETEVCLCVSRHPGFLNQFNL